MAHAHRQLPHPEPVDAWTQALRNLHEADVRFAPVQAAFNQAERAWFAVKNDHATVTHPEQQHAKACFDEASEQERIFGNALFEAASAVYRTPAPHLAGVIQKIEIIEMIGYDGSVEQLILKDLRRLEQSG